MMTLKKDKYFIHIYQLAWQSMHEKDKGLIDGYNMPLSHAIICYYYKSYMRVLTK